MKIEKKCEKDLFAKLINSAGYNDKNLNCRDVCDQNGHLCIFVYILAPYYNPKILCTPGTKHLQKKTKSILPQESNEQHSKKILSFFCYSHHGTLLLPRGVLLAEYHVLQHLVDVPVSFFISTHFCRLAREKNFSFFPLLRSFSSQRALNLINATCSPGKRSNSGD